MSVALAVRYPGYSSSMLHRQRNPEFSSTATSISSSSFESSHLMSSSEFSRGKCITSFPKTTHIYMDFLQLGTLPAFVIGMIDSSTSTSPKMTATVSKR